MLSDNEQIIKFKVQISKFKVQDYGKNQTF